MYSVLSPTLTLTNMTLVQVETAQTREYIWAVALNSPILTQRAAGEREGKGGEAVHSGDQRA